MSIEPLLWKKVVGCIKERRWPWRVERFFRSVHYAFAGSYFASDKTKRKATFSRIYYEKMWGTDGGRFYSGAGSHLQLMTGPYIAAISGLLKSYEPQKPRLVDLGCGDFMIGKHFIKYASQYVCVDVVPEMIAGLRRAGYPDHVKFLCLDIVSDDLPDGDVCFLRQVLQHLSNKEILQVISKLNKYKVVFFTEHYPAGSSQILPNIDIISGVNTRVRLNSAVYLGLPPFNLREDSLKLILEVPATEEGQKEPSGVLRTYKWVV